MKTMKMTRGNYLSLDSHSIFHTMKRQNMNGSFQCGKFERLIFLHNPSTTTRKNYTSERKLCDMIKDDGEIYFRSHK